MFRLAGLRQLSHRFPSVRAVLLLAAVMIVATVVATAVLLAELRQENLRRAQGEIVTLTRVLAEQMTRTFEGVSLTLHGIKERLSDDVGTRLELDSELVRFLLLARSAGLPQVKSIFVVDAQGRGVNSSRPDFIPRLDVTARPFYRNVVDGDKDTLFISACGAFTIALASLPTVSATLLGTLAQLRAIAGRPWLANLDSSDTEGTAMVVGSVIDPPLASKAAN